MGYREICLTIFLIIIIILVFYLFYYFISTQQDETYKKPELQSVRQKFSLINPEFTRIPLKEGNSSYTENKSSITLCLKDPKTGNHYTENTINYVAIHELAHVITKSQGHGDEFKKNFNILLKRANELGFYDPRQQIPTNYCGIKG